ncbi:unnamed protein product [Spirodela intermedia]|uniref:Uncharacterized protein n=1 Tax=Spirodela intermedia TaxID=51605 RepID=A0A7I8IY57_SPIIN|nr:unnamed protein product [Spirodela intermedia]CAA6661941.1 unnamed protein product [Spirodela intermedia]
MMEALFPLIPSLLLTRQCGSSTVQLGFPSFTVSGKRNVAARASENDGSDSSSPSAPDAGKEASASVEGLPLESKLQLRLEQKLKMKLAKKIRLRRKRLVRKRVLRKKGRWPPSKMKKNKNV